MSLDKIKSVIQSSIEVKSKIFQSESILNQISRPDELCLESLRSGGKINYAGNEDSFANSQDLAAEFISRLQLDRDPLASVAIGTNSSSTTAIRNDYRYDQIFVRELNAISNPGDVYIPTSTSGNSANVLSTIDIAKSKNLQIVALTGETGSKLKPLVECICVPSKRTERIQEANIMIGHITCGLVDDGYFKK